jgi:amino acid transporter
LSGTGDRLHSRRCDRVLYIPATTDDIPRFLVRTNRHGTPVPALVMAAGLVSLLLVALLFAADALDFMLDLTAALSLIPYLLAAGYMLKLTLTRETYNSGQSLVGDMIVAGLATMYTLYLIYAAGVESCCCRASCTRRPQSFTSRPAASAIFASSGPQRRCFSG